VKRRTRALYAGSAGFMPAIAASFPVLAAEGAGPGFPQLDASTYPSQVFWLIVSFALLYVLMSKVALPGVSSVLEKRRAARQDDLDRASDLSAEASRIQHGYEYALSRAQETARETLAAAAQETSERLAAESARFAEEARKRVAAAEQSIASAKVEAQRSLADIAADIAADMTSAVAGVKAGKAEAQKAVGAVMKE